MSQRRGYVILTLRNRLVGVLSHRRKKLYLLGTPLLLLL